VTNIVAEARGWFQTFYILDVATGLCFGKLIGLEVRHFDGSSIKVEQSVWSGDAQEPKTQNAYRNVDLHSDVAKRVSDFIGDRNDGYICGTRNGRPLGGSNVLRRPLHPILKKFGIEKQGLHSLRRIRNTFVRNHTSCPHGLRNYWPGWAENDMSGQDDKVREDGAFRKEVAERVGIGFVLPKPSIVPNAVNVPSQTEGVELVTA
jgi:integrase